MQSEIVVHFENEIIHSFLQAIVDVELQELQLFDLENPLVPETQRRVDFVDENQKSHLIDEGKSENLEVPSHPDLRKLLYDLIAHKLGLLGPSIYQKGLPGMPSVLEHNEELVDSNGNVFELLECIHYINKLHFYMGTVLASFQTILLEGALNPNSGIKSRARRVGT